MFGATSKLQNRNAQSISKTSTLFLHDVSITWYEYQAHAMICNHFSSSAHWTVSQTIRLHVDLYFFLLICTMPLRRTPASKTKRPTKFNAVHKIQFRLKHAVIDGSERVKSVPVDFVLHTAERHTDVRLKRVDEWSKIKYWTPFEQTYTENIFKSTTCQNGRNTICCQMVRSSIFNVKIVNGEKITSFYGSEDVQVYK